MPRCKRTKARASALLLISTKPPTLFTTNTTTLGSSTPFLLIYFPIHIPPPPSTIRVSSAHIIHYAYKTEVGIHIYSCGGQLRAHQFSAWSSLWPVYGIMCDDENTWNTAALRSLCIIHVLFFFWRFFASLFCICGKGMLEMLGRS